MLVDWTHAGPTVLAAFFASLVEFVEAFTVVLAVGAVRGWRCSCCWPSCFCSARR
jgi:Ca2+/H+ antiporter, TMEM165/GDT1 family